MKHTLDISISIVCYRNYNEVLRTVQYINKYTKTLKKEIIIVDNTEPGYRDLNLIKSILAQKGVNLVFTGNNIGFGKANNFAFTKSKGKFFAIINPDILFIEDSLGKIIRYMDENNIDAVIPRLVDTENNLLPVYRRNITVSNLLVRYINPFGLFNRKFDYQIMQDKNYSQPFQVPFGQGSFLVIRSILFKKIHGFDERYFMYLEDADLCRKINQYSSLIYFPGTSAIHIWKRSSHKNIKLMLIHMNSMLKYFKKWGIN